MDDLLLELEKNAEDTINKVVKKKRGRKRKENQDLDIKNQTLGSQQNNEITAPQINKKDVPVSNGTTQNPLPSVNVDAGDKKVVTKKPTLNLKNIYGNPKKPKYTEDCVTLNYSLCKDGDTFYMHPVTNNIVYLAAIKSNPDKYKLETYKHELNLKPFGACMHCGLQNFKERIPSVRAYDYSTRVFTVWGNFHSFSCAMAYEMERYSFDTPNNIVYLNKLAREFWGFTAPIRRAAPQIMYKTFGGNLDPMDIEKESEKKHYQVISGHFVSSAMLIESQSLPKESAVNRNSPDRAKKTGSSLVALGERNVVLEPTKDTNEKVQSFIARGMSPPKCLVGYPKDLDPKASKKDDEVEVEEVEPCPFDQFVERKKLENVGKPPSNDIESISNTSNNNDEKASKKVINIEDMSVLKPPNKIEKPSSPKKRKRQTDKKPVKNKLEKIDKAPTVLETEKTPEKKKEFNLINFMKAK